MIAIEERCQKPISLTLIVPVYNEEEAIPAFIVRVNEIFASESLVTFNFCFVNDGSTDETLAILLGYQKLNARLNIIDLSRNFGKEAALTAGLNAVDSDVAVPIDVDLQDPPELILEMIAMWRLGYDVVLARRVNRTSDSWLKRVSATTFYRIHNKIASPKIPENVGDFRLIDRRVVDALRTLSETHRFMKGLFAWVGFRSVQIEYVRPRRTSGTSKFNGWKLWNFALEGITSFSTNPLRIWTYIGFLVSALSFAFGSIVIIDVALRGISLPGYASLAVGIAFLGGLQLMGIGILGEYLGRTFMETKRRPTYIVNRIYKPDAVYGP